MSTAGATVPVGARRGFPVPPRAGRGRLLVTAVAGASLGAGGLALARGRGLTVTILVLAIAASVAVGGAAWAEERYRRHRLQLLYQSHVLLQGSSGSPPSMETLLLRLCQVLRASFAEVVILPDAIDRSALVVQVRDGKAVDTARALDQAILDDVFSVVVPRSLSLLLRRREEGGQGGEILRRRNLGDAVMAALVVDGRVVGTVLTGDRRGRRGFGEDDRQLLEALAPQVAITVDRARLDARLSQQAFHDALTGLANRSLFSDRVAHALERRVAPGRLRAAVLFIDLDDFKMVNDGLGHAAGDLLLQGVTQRLRRVVRPFDTVARLGGDEFAVLLEDLAGPEEALGVAQRFLDELAAPFELRGTTVVTGASVGVGIADTAATSPDDLLRQADWAMYRAKERGKATVETFHPGMESALEQRVQLIAELSEALSGDELTVEYQPIVSLSRGRVVGVEALARWTSPRRGRVAPREFIPIAEASGLICEIGERVLRTACRQAACWMAEHAEQELTVSVNLSPRQLLDPAFAGTVAAVLLETAIPPARLTLEITESLLVERTPETLRRLKALKDLGVTLAIDDFGTGSASLDELRRLPVDTLKIPKAFVDNVATSARDRAFLAGIIGLGRTLDLRLVVVGVEQAEQSDQLEQLRCDLVQGFHFAAPIDAAGISELLARQACGQPAPGAGGGGSAMAAATPGRA